MDDLSSSVRVVFSKKWTVPFGKAVYLIGSTFDLGEWKSQNARRMEHNYGDNWVTSIRMPINIQIQYKYFVAGFENIVNNEIEWQKFQGNHRDTIYAIPKPPLPVSICSSNIRYLNKNDQGNIHWDARKGRIVEYIRKKKHDIVGVQQATFHQRIYLQEYLPEYNYYGRARDLKKDEQCGVFLKKTYTIIEDHYDWISQTRTQGTVGYDAKLPRYFTSLLVTPKFVEPTYNRLPCLLVINAHLDHMGKLARKKGIEHIIQKCLEVRKSKIESEYFELMGCVVMGDFNASQTQSIFDAFKKEKEMVFKSMRNIPHADKSFTFNGFSNKYLLKIGELIINDKLTIDHMYYWFKENSPYHPIQFQVDKPESQAQILSDHYPIVGVFGRKGYTPQ